MFIKKEKFLIFLMFFIFVFGILTMTETLTCGWHLVDDHEYTEYELMMDEPGENVFTCMVNVVKDDLNYRFRPLYYIFRVALTAVWGSNLVAWSVLKALETVFALFFLYLFVRQNGGSIFDSILFSLVVMVGEQSVVWWKLGPQECTGLMIFSIGMYCLNLWLKEAKVAAKYISILFFLMMSLMKESFLILIPFVMVYIVYSHMETEKFSIRKCITSIKKEWVLHLTLAVIFLVCVYIIIFHVGTNGISYAGFDPSFTLQQYKDVWARVSRDYLIWFIRFSVPASLVLLTCLKEWRKILPWILMGLVVMIPQFILYNKNSLEERYIIPCSFGFALFFVMPVAVTGVMKKAKKSVYTILIVLLLVCHMKILVEEAEYFAYRGRSVTSVLNKAWELADEETKILAAYSPYLESDLTVSYWLLQRGFNQVYHWDESEKTCTIEVGKNRGITGNVEEMDIILFYNPKDRHYCYVPDIDLTDFDCVDYGTLTMAFRK